eukprot:gnl/MRDRNA2_/MRDRNA2_74759_c0_seq1.p1 gnl/MRDRNA2_/MRDRNA2_74759_c0~~gnl/MRDRNA2_/MRDRNA2_74759_c0_seq1.p1  ORF type:complete len:334 (+),score=63.42 gnl/MRDRNA2_/MRDRNA2_74759_c0_seq1:78-1004(+)
MAQEKFICVQWSDNPMGFSAPIYYWNTENDAYIWHGVDCMMYQDGEAFRCDSSRIMGATGYTEADYNQIQGNDLTSQRQRLQFFKKCRVTVNTLQKAGGVWVFKQNGDTVSDGGTCDADKVEDCNGKFASGISISTSTASCTNSNLAPRGYSALFAYVKQFLIDGVNPVLNVATAFEAMIGSPTMPCDGGLPVIAENGGSIYGVMAYNHSSAQQVLQQAMPTADCLAMIEENDDGKVEFENVTCESSTRRQLAVDNFEDSARRQLSNAKSNGIAVSSVVEAEANGSFRRMMGPTCLGLLLAVPGLSVP